MWIFLNDAMVSVVKHRTANGRFMVRARLVGDLQRVFGLASGRRVRRTPNADYLYRITVTRQELATAMRRAIDRIDYPNFKDSIPHGREHSGRHSAYVHVWSDMLDAQLDQAPWIDRGARGEALFSLGEADDPPPWFEVAE